MTEITSGLLFHTGIISPPQPLSLSHPVTNLPYHSFTLGTPPSCPSDSENPLCLLPGIYRERQKHKLMYTPYSIVNCINIATYNSHITQDVNSVNPDRPVTFATPFTSRLVFFPTLLQICFLRTKTTHIPKLPLSCYSASINFRLRAFRNTQPCNPNFYLSFNSKLIDMYKTRQTAVEVKQQANL